MTAEHRTSNSYMRAVVLKQYGPPDQMEIARIPRPTCGPGQVLIRVHAAAVNPIDWRIRNGSLRWLLPARMPLVLGFDVAGEIVEVGPRARKWGWVAGDEVLAFLDHRHGGGYAEYAVAGAGVVARKPTGLSFEEAAAIPLAASTALQSLRNVAQLLAGQDLLINGAAGGVGSFAVQIGKAWDAVVTGVCGTDHVDFVRQLGADHVIDHRRSDFTSARARYDVIFDAAAKSAYWKCCRALKNKGVYVRTVPSPESVFFQATTALSRRRCANMLARPRGDDLELLTQMVEAGKLRPVIQQVYPLAETVVAHRVSEMGHARGKLVLSIGPSR